MKACVHALRPESGGGPGSMTEALERVVRIFARPATDLWVCDACVGIRVISSSWLEECVEDASLSLSSSGPSTGQSFSSYGRRPFSMSGVGSLGIAQDMMKEIGVAHWLLTQPVVKTSALFLMLARKQETRAKVEVSVGKLQNPLSTKEIPPVAEFN